MFTTFLFAWAAGATAHTAGPAARGRRPGQRGADGAGPAADDCTPCEEASGCGWFESSHDLHRGIELVEVEWIDAQLPAHLAEAISFA